MVEQVPLPRSCGGKATSTSLRPPEDGLTIALIVFGCILAAFLACVCFGIVRKTLLDREQRRANFPDTGTTRSSDAIQ